jgi:hypothetical protein
MCYDVYADRSVNDIDLLVGGLTENPTSGGIVGEAFACILDAPNGSTCELGIAVGTKTSFSPLLSPKVHLLIC